MSHAELLEQANKLARALLFKTATVLLQSLTHFFRFDQCRSLVLKVEILQ